MAQNFLLFAFFIGTLTLSACGGSSDPNTDVGSDPADQETTGMPLAKLMTNVANILSYESEGVAGRTRTAFTYQHTYTRPSPRPWFGSQAANSRTETLVTTVANAAPATIVTDFYYDPSVPYDVLGLRSAEGVAEIRLVVTDSLVPLPDSAENGWSMVIQNSNLFESSDNFTQPTGTRTSIGTVKDDEFCVADKVVQPTGHHESGILLSDQLEWRCVAHPS